MSYFQQYLNILPNWTFCGQRCRKIKRCYVIIVGDMKTLIIQCYLVPTSVNISCVAGAQCAGWAVKTKWMCRTSLRRGVFQEAWSWVRRRRIVLVNQPPCRQLEEVVHTLQMCVMALILFFQKAAVNLVQKQRIGPHPQSASLTRYKLNWIIYDNI